MIKEFESDIISGIQLTEQQALDLATDPSIPLSELFEAADRIRRTFIGDGVEFCAIVNAKSGACPEDCAYCAQSSKSRSRIDIFPLIGKDTVINNALEARDGGVRRFSIVTSGKKPDKRELQEIAQTIEEIRTAGLGVCASLGLLEKDELSYLRDHGLERYHNNLEASENFFPSICSTHSYHEKIRTVEAAREIGLSVCSGGIFGMGESWRDRIDLAFAIRDLDVDSAPINFLNPIEGTRLDHLGTLNPDEALKIISIFRFILPLKEIRVCGGRIQTLGENHPMIFKAGADSVMTGNYLITTGRSYGDDLAMLMSEGLTLRTRRLEVQ
jgi:biotin synthase